MRCPKITLLNAITSCDKKLFRKFYFEVGEHPNVLEASVKDLFTTIQTKQHLLERNK